MTYGDGFGAKGFELKACHHMLGMLQGGEASRLLTALRDCLRIYLVALLCNPTRPPFRE